MHQPGEIHGIGFQEHGKELGDMEIAKILKVTTMTKFRILLFYYTIVVKEPLYFIGTKLKML